MAPMRQPCPVDALAVGAHPDDVELNCAGTILQLKNRGKRVGVVDMTRGEMGSRGTPRQRESEAQEAARILDLDFRLNLGFRDGDIEVNSANRLDLIGVIRDCRPRLVLTHSGFGHPDHASTRQLVEEAVHHAGLAKLDTGQERFRPEKIAFWISFDEPRTPQFAVDVSTFYERKEEAIRAYSSQVEGDPSQPQTYLSRPGFLDQVRAFHRHLGRISGCDYAEGFQFSRLPRIDDLLLS